MRAGGDEADIPSRVAALLVVEIVLWIRAVGCVVEGGCLDEPRIAVRAHLAGELAGNPVVLAVDSGVSRWHSARSAAEIRGATSANIGV